MADLAAKLGPSLRDPGPIPGNAREFVDYVGGRRAAAEFYSGLSGPPKRGDYTTPEEYAEDAKKWRTAQRRVQRATAAPGRQQRGQKAGPKLDDAERRDARRRGRAVKQQRLIARGLRARMRATTPVHSNPKRGQRQEVMRTMPASGPGVYLDAGTVAEILDALGDRDEAADDFIEAFLEAYGMPPDIEISTVRWLRVWPEGTPEPKGES